MYTTPKETYRDLVKKQKLKINQKGDLNSQLSILNYHIDEAQKYSKEDNIIFDRCVLDPLAYSLWMYEKGIGNFKDEDIEGMIKITKESLKLYDIIFFIPLTDKAKIPLVKGDNKFRDTDEEFRDEMNNIFNALQKSYHKQTGVIFPLEDCPPFIDIYGSREERIELTKLYINEQGKPFGEESSLISEVDLGDQ